MARLTLILLLVALAASTAQAQNLFSSQKCTGGEDALHRTCVLRNVCRSKGEWTYYSRGGEQLPTPLVSVGTYSTSPKLSLTVQEYSAPQNAATKWFTEPTFMMFCSSHVKLHWLHDEVFGLWWMKREHNMLNKMDVRVVLETPGNRPSPHDHSLHYFSSLPVAALGELDDPAQSDRAVCFSELYVGPAGNQLTGPGIESLKDDDVIAFRDYLLKREGLESPVVPREALIVYMTSKKTPRVLNDELVVRGLGATKAHVEVMRVDEMSEREQWALARRATVLIGQHGVQMSNLFFLPKGAAVLEMFPYQFLRLTNQYLSKFVGAEYTYWQNRQESNTRFHPEELVPFNLPEKEVQAITSQPNYMKSGAGQVYWQHQDTIVEIGQFLVAVTRALSLGVNKDLHEAPQPRGGN